MDERLKIVFKIFAVFACLYFFLIGISGLSKSISGLTAPKDLTVGDMAQLKKITVEDKNITKKKTNQRIHLLMKQITLFYTISLGAMKLLIGCRILETHQIILWLH